MQILGPVCSSPPEACGLAGTADVLGCLAAQSAGQCGPCRFGLPAVAQDFAALAYGPVDLELIDRLRRRVGLLPGRGACRHPDGASRLADTALRTFADDVQRHPHRRPCAAAGEPAVITVPTACDPEKQGWR